MEEKIYTAPTIYTVKVERSQSLASGSLTVKPDTNEELSGGGEGDASSGL